MSEKGTKWLSGLLETAGVEVLWEILKLAASFTVANWQVSMMPGGWHPPQYWLYAGSWFFGTWATLGLLAVGVRKTVPVFKRWKAPHDLTLTPNGGKDAVVIVTHSGEPATWTADARITSAVGEEPDPSGAPFQCRIHKDEKASRSVLLQHDEWGTIVLGSIRTEIRNHSMRRIDSWLVIGETIRLRRAREAVVELTIKANPPMKGGAIKQLYRVSWSGVGVQISPESGIRTK